MTRRQAPADSALRRRMLVVVLGWENVPRDGSDGLSAAFASVYSGPLCARSRLADRVERFMRGVRQKLVVLVKN
jgi:hypothetical protein